MAVSAATLKPVTTSGWYERTDGTIGFYAAVGGSVRETRSAPSWADVPSREDDLRADDERP